MSFKHLILAIISSLLIIGFTACDDSTDPETVDREVTVNFSLLQNGQQLNLNTDYERDPDQTFNIDLVKFYISTFTLANTDTSVLLSDVELIDLKESPNFTATIPQGDYQELNFIIGLTPEQNAIDPATISVDEPLGPSDQMWWGWTARHIYFKLEGAVDDDPDAPFLGKFFIYHVGRDDMSRSVEMNNLAISISEDQTNINVGIDWDIFTQGIDLIDENFTHSSGDEVELAIDLADNFAGAISVQ